MRIAHALVSSIVLASGLVLAGTGCSSSDDGSSGPSTASFAATAEPLPGFSYDTGLVPAASPAQVQMVLSAGGAIKIDAVGTNDGGKIAPRAGSGKLTLDIHVKATGKLKVDTALKKYDGDLPGLKNLDIPIAGEVAFDPFLLDDGETAEVTADVPETKLPPIPLGSVPGELQLTVMKGSTLTTKYHGTCVAVSGGKATYSGQATTSGKLVLKGSLALKLPSPLDKAVDLPAFDVAIPETPTALDSAAVELGASDKTLGACP